MSSKPLRYLGIEIDLSGKEAKDDLAAWNREVRETIGLADESVDGFNEMAREMLDYAKNIGITKDQLRDMQQTARENREMGDFAKKYGFSLSEVQQKVKETKDAMRVMPSIDGTDEAAQEMREFAKTLGLSNKELRKLQETQKKNKEIGDFAKKYGLEASEIKRIGAEAAEAQKQVSTLRGVMGGLAALGVGAAVKSIGGEMVDLAKQAERTGITFEVMLGSKDKAKEVLAMLKDFSDVTPFSDAEAIMAGKQLINAKVPLDQLKQTLTDIGNVAAGSEVPFAELAEIYAKNKMSGIIQGEDVNQLAGRGIPILEALAKVKGVQTDQIRALAASGVIQFKDLQQAFEIMSRDNYPGLMDKLSMSAEGLSSTFDSKVASIKKTLGAVLLEGLKPLWAVGIQFIDWIQNNKVALGMVKVAFLVLIPIVGTILVASLWAAASAAWGAAAGAIGLQIGLFPLIAIIGIIGFVILGLIMVIEDLYTAFTGGDSIIGQWIDVGKIKAKFSAAWGAIKEFFSSVLEFFKQYGKFFVMAIFPLSSIYFYWDQISEFLKSIPDRIVSFFKSIPDRIMSMLAGVKNILKGLLPDWALKLLANVKISGETKQIQARASGGPISAGDRYIVGEQGPELFESDRTGTITPNHALGKGGRTSISLAPVFNISGVADPEAVARIAIKKIEAMIPFIAAELGLEIS